MKRNLALLLMVALLATACGGEAGTTPTTTTSGNETTSEPVEDSLFESDDLPADLKFGGKTLKINVQETRLKQYYIEEETGDIVDDSIYTARRNVEDRLDVVLEYPTGAYLTWADRSTYIDQIMSSVMAGADDFDVLCSSTFIVEFMVRGILTDISETPYLKLPVMEMDMRRNEITAVSIDYNTSEGIWEIKMFIRGEWITIHRLDIF